MSGTIRSNQTCRTRASRRRGRAISRQTTRPPQGPANLWGFTPWAQEVLAASGGTVEVKIFPGGSIADFNKVYDRVLNGVADIGYGIFGPVSTDFPKSMVASLPFEANNVEEAALALWRIYENGLIADEYSRVKLLALFNFSDNGKPFPHIDTQ